MHFAAVTCTLSGRDHASVAGSSVSHVASAVMLLTVDLGFPNACHRMILLKLNMQTSPRPYAMCLQMVGASLRCRAATASRCLSLEASTPCTTSGVGAAARARSCGHGGGGGSSCAVLQWSHFARNSLLVSSVTFCRNAKVHALRLYPCKLLMKLISYATPLTHLLLSLTLLCHCAAQLS